MCLRSSTGKEKKKKRVQYYIHRYIVGKGNNKRWKQPIQVKLVIKHKKKGKEKKCLSKWVSVGADRDFSLRSPSYSPKSPFFLC